MNNENDYLWDRTGQPDPEVKELEEILGSLQYQRQPLRIPQMSPRRNTQWSSWLSIAAAIALVAIALSIWIGPQRRKDTPLVHTPVPASQQDQRAAAGSLDEKKLSDLRANVDAPAKQPHSAMTEPQPIRIRRRATTTTSAPQEQTAEARAVKEQLMLALRVTSTKLSFAQKKMTGSPVHNQHKIG